MKNIFLLLVFFLSVEAFAVRDITTSTVVSVYQKDGSDKVFEFESDVIHLCYHRDTPYIYQVVSDTAVEANRKFSLVLAAMMSGKKLGFHDSQVCGEGTRSTVTWVRIIN